MSPDETLSLICRLLAKASETAQAGTQFNRTLEQLDASVERHPVDRIDPDEEDEEYEDDEPDVPGLDIKMKTTKWSKNPEMIRPKQIVSVD